MSEIRTFWGLYVDDRPVQVISILPPLRKKMGLSEEPNLEDFDGGWQYAEHGIPTTIKKVNISEAKEVK